MGEVWARGARRVGARPWTVNLYVLLGAALVFYVWVQAGWDNAWPLLFHLLVGVGVWMGSRIAWALGLALYSAAGIAAAASFRAGPGAAVALLFGLWVVLLLAPPTRRWIDRRRRVPASLGTP